MPNSPTEPMNNTDLDWEIKPLLSLVEKRKGKKPSDLTDNYTEDSLPYIDIEAFEKGVIKRYTTDKSAPVASEKDVLVVWDGARCGLSGMANGAIGSTLMKLTPKDIEPEYLLLYLQSKYKEINTNPRGTGIPHVEPDLFWNMEVPVPNEAIRKSIINKYKSISPEIERAQGKTLRAKQLIQKFRQSVLSSAFQGKLTETWRNHHTDLIPADELIRQIKETNGKPQKMETIENVDEMRDLFSDIPETWRFCQIADIGKVVNGSTPSRKEKKFWDGNIPWVSSGEVNNNIISFTREKITKEGYDNSSVKLLPVGTVLLAMIGEGKTRGRSSVLDIEATTNQNIAAITLEHGLILPKYLWYWFQFQYDMTRNYGSGSGPQALSCARVRSLPFVLAPLEEQQIIINKIEKCFDLISQIEKQIQTSSGIVEKLTQSILAKAFKGELIS